MPYETYGEWIAEVNRILEREMYLPSLRDLPDRVCWPDHYDAGESPREALRTNIREITDGMFGPSDV